MNTPVYTFSDYLFSFFLTTFVYDFIPIIISIIGKKHKLSTIRIISIINYILGYSFFYLLKSPYGDKPHIGTAILWSSMGYWLMKDKCLKSAPDDAPVNTTSSDNIVSFPSQTHDDTCTPTRKKNFFSKVAQSMPRLKKVFHYFLRVFACVYFVCSLFIIFHQHNKLEQLTSYDENVSDYTKHTINSDSQADIYPISHCDLESGVYDGQKVYIICRLENVKYSPKGSLSFDIYIADVDNSYVYSDTWTLSPDYVKNHSTLSDVQNGDYFQFGVYVYPGSTIDANGLFFSKKMQN